jgi:Tol biopolymer transport system component
MRENSGRAVGVLCWILSFACTLTISLEPKPEPMKTGRNAPTDADTPADSPNPTVRLLTPTPARWTFPRPAPTLDPAAEPKGWIAFERGSVGGEGVYTVAAGVPLSGNIKYLFYRGTDPLWSPDGRWIAMDAYRMAPVSEYPAGLDSAGIVGTELLVDDIAAVDATGAGLRKFTAMGAGDRLWNFSWSPDGRWIAAVRSFTEFSPGEIRHSSPEVYAVKTDGSGTMVRIGEAAGVDCRIDWFPDGRLVFLDPAGSLRISSVDFPDQTRTERASAPLPDCRSFDVSPDGDFLVFLEVDDAEYRIKAAYLAGRRTGEDLPEVLLYRGALENSEHFAAAAGDLTLSPDGTRMVYVLSEKGVATLMLYTAGSDAPIALDTLSDCSAVEADVAAQGQVACWSPDWRPGWSPDGQWIVYAAADGSDLNYGNIYIRNAAQAAAGSGVPFLQAGLGRSPDWQPFA